jgi:hypothetical protein
MAAIKQANKQGANNMKVSKFSNGHTDKYQGKRNVEAAWMITEIATGRVVGTGHSLTKELAAKTAAGNMPRVAWAPVRRGVYEQQRARRAGFASVSAMQQDARAKNAAHAALHKIEVVAL